MIWLLELKFYHKKHAENLVVEKKGLNFALANRPKIGSDRSNRPVGTPTQ